MSAWKFSAPEIHGVSGDAHFSAPVLPDRAEREVEQAPGALPSLPPHRPSKVPLLLLVLATAVFVYLWFSAGHEVGTWWWPVWYGAALVQGLVATLILLQGRAGEHGIRPAATALLTFCFAAPLLHVLLLETILCEPDRGDRRTAWAETAGRALSLAATAAAIGAVILMNAPAAPDASGLPKSDLLVPKIPPSVQDSPDGAQ